MSVYIQHSDTYSSSSHKSSTPNGGLTITGQILEWKKGSTELTYSLPSSTMYADDAQTFVYVSLSTQIALVAFHLSIC